MYGRLVIGRETQNHPSVVNHDSPKPTVIDFPRNLNIIEFLKKFNGETEKVIYYDDVEEFISTKIKSTVAVKMCVLIKLYTDKIDTLGEDNYAQVYTHFSESLSAWIKTLKENGKTEVKQMKESFEEDKKKHSKPFSFEKIAKSFYVGEKKKKNNTKKLDHLALEVRLLTLRAQRSSITKARSILKELDNDFPQEYKITKAVAVLILERGGSLHMGDTLVKIDKNSKMTDLQRAIITRDKKLLENVEATIEHYITILKEFIEDIMCAIGNAFGKLVVKKESTNREDLYCMMFYFVSDLLGLKPGIELPLPKVDFALYFLMFTGATSDLNLERYRLSAFQPLGKQILRDINRDTPNNAAILKFVENVISKDFFLKHILRKLLWMSDHSYYFDFLSKLKSDHPRFEHRQKLRKALECKFITVSNWDGELRDSD